VTDDVPVEPTAVANGETVRARLERRRLREKACAFFNAILADLATGQ